MLPYCIELYRRGSSWSAPAVSTDYMVCLEFELPAFASFPCFAEVGEKRNALAHSSRFTELTITPTQSLERTRSAHLSHSAISASAHSILPTVHTGFVSKNSALFM